MGVSETPSDPDADDSTAQAAAASEHDGEVVTSQVSGGVWAIAVREGDTVSAGQALVVVESIKMEITVHALTSGRIERILCSEGQAVQAGQPLVLMR